MILVWHAVLFGVAALAGYLLNTDRGETFGLILLAGAAIAGVYLVDWWTLLTVLAGAFVGSRAQFGPKT